MNTHVIFVHCILKVATESSSDPYLKLLLLKIKHFILTIYSCYCDILLTDLNKFFVKCIQQ